ncbi:hypothetical protein HU200_026785 [Digitaria exilis]|uniref:Uncharacterized protein n=1 Tax=Digitaria exilis TaxID=1010633 RepID=A0A835ERH4_9POAL|nr:hypothetical protein HU200_026785 [Digitaria exilis]
MATLNHAVTTTANGTPARLLPHCGSAAAMGTHHSFAWSAGTTAQRRLVPKAGTLNFIADYYTRIDEYPVRPAVAAGFLARPEPDALAAALVRDLILLPGVT